MNDSSSRRTNLGFQDVDQLGDKAEATRFLDATAKRLEQFKRDSYTTLGVTPGKRILDVGCGTGDDVRAMAALVGSTGSVIGLDSSADMIGIARERGGEDNLPITFIHGDVRNLPFEDNEFDGCRAERVLEHVAEPGKGLAEMIRVTRPGGRVFASDVDLGTLVIDHPEPSLLNKVRELWIDDAVNGLMGRELSRFFRLAGLTNVHVVASTAAHNPSDDAPVAISPVLDRLYLRALETGVFTQDEYDRWVEGIEKAKQSDLYFSSITAYAATGTKPDSRD